LGPQRAEWMSSRFTSPPKTPTHRKERQRQKTRKNPSPLKKPPLLPPCRCAGRSARPRLLRTPEPRHAAGGGGLPVLAPGCRTPSLSPSFAPGVLVHTPLESPASTTSSACGNPPGLLCLPLVLLWYPLSGCGRVVDQTSCPRVEGFTKNPGVGLPPPLHVHSLSRMVAAQTEISTRAPVRHSTRAAFLCCPAHIPSGVPTRPG